MAASFEFLRCCQCCKFCGRLSHLKSVKDKTVLGANRLYTSKAGRKWHSVVGLEVHAQIQANSKLFSGASAEYGGVVNTQVSFLDSALPGTLPVINRQCVEAGVKTALALGCTINRVSKFDRKHYFYADLPAGYQITQQRQAIANGGTIKFVVPKQGSKKQAELKSVRLTQLQLEQDSGKSLHDVAEKKSLIDLNRAGCGLMEIISEPEISNGTDAAAYIRELRKILMTIDTCDGKMSEGSLRVDANISIHRPGEPLGTRTEVKNLNSVRVVNKAIDYEIERQIGVLESGGVVVNETRSFDDESGETVPMRDKEIKQDYRFMPEPNLPPLHLYTSDTVDPAKSGEVVLIDKLSKGIPTLPGSIRERLMEAHGLSLYEASAIVDWGLLHYFEALVVKDGKDSKDLTRFLVDTFYGYMLQHMDDLSECPVQAEAVGCLFDWMTDEKISQETTQKVLTLLVSDPDLDPYQLIESNNWWLLNDEEILTRLCRAELDNDPALVAKYKIGKKKVINRFIGNVKKATDGRGNGRIISKILKDLMSK